ncbi:MAG TPA: hypothetical protein VGA01_12230 [Candidatus Binatia bacterium]
MKEGELNDKIQKTWENLLSESVLPKKQYPSLEGIKTILTLEIKGKPAKREDFADFDLCQGIGPKRLHRGAVQKTMIG